MSGIIVVPVQTPVDNDGGWMGVLALLLGQVLAFALVGAIIAVVLYIRRRK